MKLLPLLLALATGLFLQAAASAQGLAGTAEQLRDALKALAGAVGDKVGKDDGRGEILLSIDKARGDAKEVAELAGSGAPRATVAERFARLRDHVGDTQRRLGGQRGSLRNLSDIVADYMTKLETRWAEYGYEPRRPGFSGGPPPPPVSRDERAAGIASRELAENLRVSPNAVSVTRLERLDGDRYRAFATVRTQRYVVELNTATGKIISTNPLR